MNQNVPFLTRQMVYGFLIGLIVGGVAMAFFDTYAKKPLFSDAFAPSDNTRYCGDGLTVCDNPYGGGGRSSSSSSTNSSKNQINKSPAPTPKNWQNDGWGDMGDITSSPYSDDPR